MMKDVSLEKSNGEKGGTTGHYNIIFILERNYLDQGLCNKIKGVFLMICYITLFVLQKQSVT